MSRVKVGDVLWLRMPWSEACMALHINEQYRHVRVLEHGAQVLNHDGTNYSFPITHGEAGIYTDAQGLYTDREIGVSHHG